MVKIGGKPVALKRADGSLLKGKGSEEEAMTLWHRMMAVGNAASTGEDTLVCVIFEHYLRYLMKYAAEKTYKEYNKAFTSFFETYPEVKVKDLRPLHMEEWWEKKHPNWEDGTRLFSATAVHAALNWASGAQARLIPNNPLKGMRMPKGRSRGAEALVDLADHQKLIAAVPEDLRDVLVALRHTGTRPSTVSRVTANDFFVEQGIWRVMNHKTVKKTGKPLIVPLPPVIVELSKKLAEKYPEGPLFRTARGVAWNPQKLASRILWYKKKLGVDVIAYGYRHTVATELLEAGVPDAQVAAILGQSNTAMIYKHYSHLGSKINSLRDILTEHTKAPKPTGDDQG
jgi:integrase